MAMGESLIGMYRKEYLQYDLFIDKASVHNLFCLPGQVSALPLDFQYSVIFD